MGISCFDNGQKPKKLTPEDKYDFIVDIDSIRSLNNEGWQLYESHQSIMKEFLNASLKKIISVLGNSNRGKTYLLQKLSGEVLPTGFQIHTRGLSIKQMDNDLMLLDTAGTNIPLLLDRSNDRPNEKEINDIYLCQIITNYILQTFVISQAHIIICVVGMLTSAEQQFMNKIKKLCENKKQLIIIHNLIKCYRDEDIKKYRDEILLKMLTNKLKERTIPYFDEKYKNYYNKYFIEMDNNDVLHFLYGNDQIESEMKYYNKSVLDFIKKKIRTSTGKSSNIVNDLIEHIKYISSTALIKELDPILNRKNNVIKCSESIQPKEILADELDNIIFVGKEYEPMYRYYNKNNYFIIEIQMCSKYKDLKIEKTFVMSTKEYKLIITGERIIEEEKSISTIFDKRENFKRFKLEILTKLEELGEKTLNGKYKEILKYGILFLVY